jgi:small subunit ribosomal protein S6
MVIFDTAAEPPAIQAVVDRMLETVRANEGTPGHVDRWGRRPFAYEVKHRREGYYVLVELSGVSRTVFELDRMLSLADEVLRHKVIRLPDKPLRRTSPPRDVRTAGRGAPGGPRARREGAGAGSRTGTGGSEAGERAGGTGGPAGAAGSQDPPPARRAGAEAGTGAVAEPVGGAPAGPAPTAAG